MIAVYLALVGATIALVRGALFRRVRAIATPLGCAQCTGFWVGVAGTALLPTRTGLELYSVRVGDGLVSGLGVSLLALVADALLVRLLGEPEETTAQR